MTVMPADAMTERRCAGTKKDGSRCSSEPELLHQDDAGVFWCWNHDPDPALEAERELARSRGGQATARRFRNYRYLDAADLRGELDSPAQAALWAATIARALAFGRLSSAAGHAALKAIESFLRAFEVTDLTNRLTALEARASEDEARRTKEAAARAAEARRQGVPYMVRGTGT
jgi:hypothetical protein